MTTMLLSRAASRRALCWNGTIQRRPRQQRQGIVARSESAVCRQDRFFTIAAANNISLAVDEHRIVTSGDDNTIVQDELAAIIQSYYKEQRPVVVRGAVQTAPATTLWTNWDYWKQDVAEWDSNDNDDATTTMVAVELGGSYGSEQSERAEIPFLAYLQYLELFEERHGRTGNAARNDPKFSTNEDQPPPLSSWSIPSSELVYMAQNELPHPLYKDIFIPDFCQSSNNSDDANEVEDKDDSSSLLGLGRLYSVMLWLGPRGCASPLHFDPLDNCLMQHVGRKRVLLYEPAAATTTTGWHYAGHDGQQSNTSPVNPEVMDTENDNDSTKLLQQEVRSKHPLFLEAAPPRLECFLDAGDLLYIPAKWWHHVRSIDTSASVNVWWR